MDYTKPEIINKPTTQECKACGCFFSPTSTRQMYCNECSKGRHGLRKKKQYDKKAYRTKLYQNLSNPEILTHKCRICGKLFQTTYKNKFICSDKCVKYNLKLQMRCSNCGERLYHKMDLNDIPDTDLHKRHHFCSEKCHTEFTNKHVEHKICLNCGETYTNRNKYFCSRECQKKYRKGNKAKS